MVARFDLIFFTDLLLRPLLQGAPLWLPTWCMRYPINNQQYRSYTSQACGGHNRGVAYILTPPRVSTMHPRLRSSITPAADVDMAMLDWFFVAPPAIANTFAAIYDRFGEYSKLLGRAYRGIPLESHYFWAYHVNHVLRLGSALRYINGQVEGRDFRLARQVIHAWPWPNHPSAASLGSIPRLHPSAASLGCIARLHPSAASLA